MKRLGVIADAHANLPATRAALDALRAEACEMIVHLGDAVGLGPHPAEVMDLLAARDVICLMGNHDELQTLEGAFVSADVSEPLLAALTEEHLPHYRWVHAQLSERHREQLRSWPYELELEMGSRSLHLLHYPRNADDGAFRRVAETSAAGEDLAELFASVPGDIVLFGHDHACHDVHHGGRRFIDPGSVGCNDRPVARALLLSESDAGDVDVRHLAAPYDDADFLPDFERRDVPVRDFILSVLITRP